MPIKRNYRKKRPYRKKRVYRKKNAISRPIPRPKVYGFSRSRENLLALESPSDGWITTLDDAVVKTFAYDLAMLPAYTEFTNLFEQYKLNMVILKFYPSYSQVVSTTAPVASTNVVITVWPNTHGQPLTAAFDDTALLQVQRKRQWMFPLNRPTQLKMFLKQLSANYGGALNTDYTTMKPRYVSTLETGMPHYGLNVHIKKVDGSAFASNSARLLIQEKIYLTCKQVK